VITVTYEAPTTFAVQAITIVNMDIFEKQSTKVAYRNFVGHSGQTTLFQASYMTSYPVPNTAFIQLEFPVSDIVAGTLTNFFVPDLGSGLAHGYKILCLDVAGTLGPDYKCQIF
jgi:hypothetical protein